MKALRIPVSMWDWRATALVLVLMVAPLLATSALLPEGTVPAAVGDARGLLVSLAALTAGVLLHLHWRITANDTTGWLALLVTVPAVPGLTLGALTLADRASMHAERGSLLAFQVVIGAGLLWALLASRTVRLRGNPLALGLATGFGLAGIGHVALAAGAGLPAPPAFGIVRVVLLAGLAAPLALVVLGLDRLSRRARARLATGVLVLLAGSALDGMVGLAVGVLGGAVLAGTAAVMLHRAIDEQERTVEDLRLRVDALELGVRADRARLHEIDATVAGIVSAQELMDEDVVTADRSDALAAMMRAEVDRLQRLVSGHGSSRLRSVDLDDVLGQIVLSHVARGRSVAWAPSGLSATGRADDIAEIVNVLLENAAVHGGPGPVSLRAAHDTDGAAVVITVADQGRGVPPDLRERVFDWGVSRPGSPGQGIGLNVAADLARQLGGRLELLPAPVGTTFALHLRPVAQGVREHDRVVRAG